MAGAGVWNFGARCLVTALERSGTPCQALDAVLGPLSALILPGGYAPVEYYGLGWSGLKAVTYWESAREAISRSAILIRWRFLTAPVAGLPVYLNYGPVQISLTPAGRESGLAGLEKRTLLYGSEPRFVGGTGVTVLMTYGYGTVAAISRPLRQAFPISTRGRPARRP